MEGMDDPRLEGPLCPLKLDKWPLVRLLCADKWPPRPAWWPAPLRPLSRSSSILLFFSSLIAIYET